VCVCMRVCARVCVRERERERLLVCRARDRRVALPSERERESERVCVRVSVYVCEGERGTV